MTDLPKDYDGLLEQYNKLKEELEEQNTIYDEYIKELENSKADLTKRLEIKEKEFDDYSKELKKFKDRNDDTAKDIEYLEKQLEKEKAENAASKEKINKLELNIVELENENTDLSGKYREFECYNDELSKKLDAALEENIILHNELDQFKLECDEKIQRIQEELEDNKNEVLSKEKLIAKLTSHRDFLVKTAVKGSEDMKMNLSKTIENQEDVIQSEGKNEEPATDGPSSKMQMNDKKSSDIALPMNLKSQQSSNSRHPKIPENFVKQLTTSCLNLADEGNMSKDSDDEDEKEFLMQKIQMEVKNNLENRRNFVLKTLNTENFSFDVLSLDGPNKKNKVKKALEINDTINEVLGKIRDRKDKVMTQKRLMQAKFEKLGIKIN